MPAPGAAEATLVLRLRRSRRKARDAATSEVAALLRDVGGDVMRGGPLSEVSGVAWVSFAEPASSEVLDRLRNLGYSEAVELVRPADEVDDPEGTFAPARWRGRDVVLVPVYAESDEVLREHAPDRRSFLLECGDGVVRRIAGYRGGRGELEHRALPVADARLLVNLVAQPGGGRLLDPFAGAGGIVIEARKTGWTSWSVDVDPTLRFGLAELADLHVVGDAVSLPFASGSVDAVATEPPYHASALEIVRDTMTEMARVVRPGGRVALLAGAAQATAVREAGKAAGLTNELDTAIDRKGTDVACFCWVK